MGPHRKSRKKLEEYFEEEDKPKPLEISSALQSNSLNSKKKSQSGFEVDPIGNFRNFEDSDNKSETSIEVSNLHPDVTEEMLLEMFQSIRVFGSLYVACINFEQQYHTTKAFEEFHHDYLREYTMKIKLQNT